MFNYSSKKKTEKDPTEAVENPRTQVDRKQLAACDKYFESQAHSHLKVTLPKLTGRAEYSVWREACMSYLKLVDLDS